MNFENNAYTATMLATTNGYLVKVHKNLEDGWYQKICFYVDKDFNYRVWKKTIEKGIPLSSSEFYRFKREQRGKISETTLSKTQIEQAIVLAEKVADDPYYNMDQTLKDGYLANKTLDGYTKAFERDICERMPAKAKSVPSPVPVIEEAIPVPAPEKVIAVKTEEVSEKPAKAKRRKKKYRKSKKSNQKEPLTVTQAKKKMQGVRGIHGNSFEVLMELRSA